VEGPASNPAGAIANIVLKDFRINWGSGAAGGSGLRCCAAVSARNVKDMVIDGLEIYNTSQSGIKMGSWQRGRIVNNYIHDGMDDSGHEYSGIIAEDASSGVESTEVEISGNRFISLRVSETGYNAGLADPLIPDGYQPNAIKLTEGNRYQVTNNFMQYTGQAIDMYSENSVIANNVMDHVFGAISLKHNTSNNVIANNVAEQVLYWGVALGGDAAPNQARDNIVIGNFTKDIQVDNWAALGWANPAVFQNQVDTPGSDGSCYSTFFAIRNTFIGNYCDPGSHGEFMYGSRGGGTIVATEPNYWLSNTGKPGISTVNAGRFYSNGDNEPLSITDDAGIRAYRPWVDVTAGGVTQLSTAPGSNLINVIGANTTILDFAGGTAGAVFILKFNGAYTLRCPPWVEIGPGAAVGNTGNLYCPNGGTSGTSIITAAGDMMALVVEVPKNAQSGGGGNKGAYRIAWYRKGDGTALVSGSMVNTNAADGIITLKRSNAAADVIPIYLANSAATADGAFVGIDFSTQNLNNGRSVQIGEIDKPTTTTRCFSIRTSNAAVAAERTFTCLGTVVGAPSGGTNGDMGAGTLNATGLYVNGVAVVAQAAVSTVAGLPTCNGAAEGVRRGVTDANSTTYNATAAGGGANHMPVYCNGTAWVLH
jgi:hypothetical protein